MNVLGLSEAKSGIALYVRSPQFHPAQSLNLKLPAVHNFSSAQQSDPMPQSPLLLPDSTILAMHLATLFDLLCCDSRLLADGDETDKQYVTTGSYPISSSNKLPARLS